VGKKKSQIALGLGSTWLSMPQTRQNWAKPKMCWGVQGYQNKRLVRASAIHGLAGSAAIMASTYKAFLGEGLGPLGDLLLPLKIPHPGKVTLPPPPLPFPLQLGSSGSESLPYLAWIDTLGRPPGHGQINPNPL
jgi:hypothetical protein